MLFMNPRRVRSPRPRVGVALAEFFLLGGQVEGHMQISA